MAITRAKQSSLRTGVTKYDNLRAGLPFTPTIGTATDGGTGSTVSVAFTANNTAGLTYTALSSPGSLTGTSTTSPITVSGLTSGTAYTFQVNATNSAGTSPYSAASNSVTPAAPSSFESIATVTGSGQSSITFSSIPQTYTSLQIRSIFRDTATDSNYWKTLRIQFNGDTGANYTLHRLLGDGTSVAAGGFTGQTRISAQGAGIGSLSNSNVYGASIVDIHNYALTTQNKTVRIISGVNFNTTDVSEQRIQLGSGVWLNTAAITSITLTPESTAFATGSTFALYGIKGA